MVVAREVVAAAMAAEWEAQSERIDPGTMPMTRIVNSAIDRVARRDGGGPRGDRQIRRLGPHLLPRRWAGGPGRRQDEVWSPLIAWAREALGARFVLAEGIVHVVQDKAALDAVARALDPYEALSLAAISTITTLTGSAILALAVARGRLTAAEAWAAAHVDEDWQMSLWGSRRGGDGPTGRALAGDGSRRARPRVMPARTGYPTTRRIPGSCRSPMQRGSGMCA